MLRHPFCGQAFEDSKQVNFGALLYVSPGSVGVMILALHALVEAFQGFLDANSLIAIWIIKHHPHRLVTSITNRLHPRMLLGDMIAIRGCIAPLDFQAIAAHQAIHAEKIWLFPVRIWNANRTGVREFSL